MKAVAYYKSLATTEPDALIDIDLPMPQPAEHDLLVEIKAISVNPVDTKVRKGTTPPAGEAKVLGWDATGIVKSVGSKVTLFKTGDRVWYAGSIARQGCNSEYQLVNERIVGSMPQRLSFAEAAALPLTAVTAWELLFDRLEISRSASANQSLLVIGAAGGVGSILVQLAKSRTKLKVIATASRPESVAWLYKLGVDVVVNHTQSISSQLAELGIADVDFIVSLNQTHQHFAEIVKIIKPQGKFALIDDPELFDFRLLKRKSVSLHWESMFTRSLFNTADQIRQHQILNELASLVDQGTIQTTVNHQFGKINAHHLKQAHALLESGKAIGKIVLEGF